MISNNKIYDIIKWVVLVVLPALSVLIGSLGTTFLWEYTETVVICLNAFTVFLGTATGVSAIKYNQKEEGDYE